MHRYEYAASTAARTVSKKEGRGTYGSHGRGDSPLVGKLEANIYIFQIFA